MSDQAPRASWRHPVWSTARKDGVGTALGTSRLWFTVGSGIVTEVYYPRIDIPQVRDLGFIVADDNGYWRELKARPEAEISFQDADVPLPSVRHHCDRFTFSMQVCVDPRRDVLLVDYVLEGDPALRPYLLCAARLGEDAANNLAWVGAWAGRRVLWAEQGPFGLALACRDAEGSCALGRSSVGEVGASDLWQDFHLHGRMRAHYEHAGPGELAMGGELPRRGTIALGLSTSKESAATLAWSSLTEGFAPVSDAYRREWHAWRHQCLPPEPVLQALSEPARLLYRRSGLVLRCHEDRTFPGAMVASLSIPWGEASDSRGGYHLVWSRDLVESAGALLAVGAVQQARDVLSYLISTQQADGHWLQNQWLGGKPFWQGVQLDETAFPVLLAAALSGQGALADVAVHDMIWRALKFIIAHGPATVQDRWEEDSGVNTFTLAVVIAALVEGSQFLQGEARACALMVADDWNARLEDWTFVDGSALAARHGARGYYMRISPAGVLLNEAAKDEWLLIKNRAEDPHLSADQQVGTDFLQLVRYGLRAADAPAVVDSIKVMDGLLKTDTPCGAVWHRYTGDGYGEHVDGAPFDGTGIGRGWPLLVGERGHYAAAAGDDVLPYIETMARMTGAGGLLPEQVWDDAPIPDRGLYPGQPSGSAMPLVWAHAEFIKLCHSRVLGYPVDRPAATWARYQGQRPQPGFRLWRFQQRPSVIGAGQELRVLLDAPFTLHWGVDGWRDIQDVASSDWQFGHVATIPALAKGKASRLQFTFRWQESGQWQGEDFEVGIEAEPS
ncbi:glycoside hydrolase family 15 protein [Oleiagrimonas sp. C23AA]|uniref:glycoside hydrolase family 15 protein n=1 Tax=Oleiagrimonas sp. C23AA TaxID=2719047 RepID=UPI0014235E96|nr:glycoside hydrolase family 15 protein [Oleiagrimonas sp. C23AA]NII09503.1 glycosyl hydrolase [Oleiagrimonas sp. C23AA]